MERRSWLWRRKSSEKSPGETESSGSVSSLSERFSDEQQDVSRASPIHTQSPDVSMKHEDGEAHDNVKNLALKVMDIENSEKMKSLTEKLSAALSNISAKEDLVKQHARVAEEAVSGWEKAEKEVMTLKQQLEASARKNSALEDRVVQLDGALKECVRQLRQSREDQDQKIQETLLKKAHEWESSKLELENQLSEFQSQMQAAKAAAASANHELQKKLEAVEKENSALKSKFHVQAEELKVRTLERELSIQTAETASKQHLESIKKVAKLEAECRKLQAVARKASSANDHKPTIGSSHVHSHIDSQSVSRERLLVLETDMHKTRGVDLNGCEPSCSDTWASGLIAGLDQFKNKKAVGTSFVSFSVHSDIMDDFLEMERLAALPTTENGGRCYESGAVTHQQKTQNSPFKAGLDAALQKITELEEKLQNFESEKARLEMELAKNQDQLEMSQNRFMEAQDELAELQRQLHSANEWKQAKEVEVEALNAKREAVESQLEATDSEVRTLRSKVGSLEVEIGKERALSAEIANKCRTSEDELSTRKHEAEQWQAVSSSGMLKIKQEELMAAQKFAECQKTIASLGRQLKSLATLEDFLLDSDRQEFNGGSSVPGGEWGHSYFPHNNGESANAMDGSSHSNDINEEPLPPFKSSSLANPASEKFCNEF